MLYKQRGRPLSASYCLCAFEIFCARAIVSFECTLWSPYTMISETMANLHAWIWKLRTENPSLGSHSINSGESSEGESRISSGAIAPFIFDVVRFPPVLTMAMLRRHLGTFRTLLRRDEKKANCIWFSACRPCIHGNTCSGLGRG